MKHHIVALDNIVKTPDLNFDYTITTHSGTKPEEVQERIKDATIVITSATNARITKDVVATAPRLQLVACNSTGTDHVDKDAIRERNITLCRVPAQNTASVTEHAFALYYALRRRLIPLHQMTIGGETWQQNNMAGVHLIGAPPRTNAQEIVVIVGYGNLGENVAKIATALGMTVLIAERKGAQSIRDGRVAFDQALSQGTSFFVVAPLDADTLDMIGADELAAMSKSAYVINVGRGGIINEQALANALKNGQIAGAATDVSFLHGSDHLEGQNEKLFFRDEKPHCSTRDCDAQTSTSMLISRQVFLREPATKETCPLLDPTIENLILTPHIAWYSSATMEGTLRVMKENLEAFVDGHPTNVV